MMTADAAAVSMQSKQMLQLGMFADGNKRLFPGDWFDWFDEYSGGIETLMPRLKSRENQSVDGPLR